MRSVLLWVGNVVGVASVIPGVAERAEEAEMVDTGTVKARAMSEFWGTGDVAV